MMDPLRIANIKVPARYALARLGPLQRYDMLKKHVAIPKLPGDELRREGNTLYTAHPGVLDTLADAPDVVRFSQPVMVQQYLGETVRATHYGVREIRIPESVHIPMANPLTFTTEAAEFDSYPATRLRLPAEYATQHWCQAFAKQAKPETPLHVTLGGTPREPALRLRRVTRLRFDHHPELDATREQLLGTLADLINRGDDPTARLDSLRPENS